MGGDTMPPSTERQPSARSWTWYLVVVGIGFAGAYLVGRLFPTLETALRTAGGVLELLGIATVALGVAKVRREFGLPSAAAELMNEGGQLFHALAQRVRRLFGRKPPTKVITGAGGAGLSVSGGRARATVRAGPDSTLEQRVALLERLIDSAETQLARLQDDLEREGEQLRQLVAAERQSRDEAHERLHHELRNVAVGGIRLQMVGLVWLTFGVVLANWSAELAALL
jgi:hypothetical protein